MESAKPERFIIWLAAPIGAEEYRYRIVVHERGCKFASAVYEDITNANTHTYKDNMATLMKRCKAAVFGTGWKESLTSFLEHSVATALGLPVWEHTDQKPIADLADWLRKI
jgi:hypothetical protein